ncbi:hypothetical protein OSB04_010390 [Centaurea solstitialis]|uniref:Kinesin-like protein KIN-10A n=1 Tax=Centaurea solstitialis TaxID=347529 RepID=A0AA38TIA1_9ASTR|nr:hypothetical protein OSB04_010390 [Centaurea solstitialis]
MAPITPCAKSNHQTPSSKTHHHHLMKTPQSKHRLNFSTKPSPNPNPNPSSADHPVEVIGRIRDYPDRKDKPVSVLQVNSEAHSVRLRTEIGYRDFTLDGVSLSEDEDLDGFYKNFVQSRIKGVKLGDKCTIMMYGPTGSGKSHTMFGCSAKQQGIVYKSLRDILGNGGDDDVEDEHKVGFVQVTVLEIYNEEIYDLLSTNTATNGFWSKPNASKVKLEVMGKKAKNATFISGTEAGKISKEIQKVEKRRIVKSTFCNERSSRSHCMIILDVPTVGGRLMLVDMAGSENIEQAGQIGLEAKMQTGKINQGNIALKRVVESIANGDSHVPFRDSKLTMLLQDSFEDDKSKILMILCASPDPKEMHKTISTLEYGAKAKCIVRGPHTPIKGAEDSSSDVILGSRIAAMDQFIYKLQMENKIREKEKIEAHKQLMKKEEEIAELRAKLAEAEEKKVAGTREEEEINIKVNERTNMLRSELEKKIEECQKMADRVVEMERRKMEEKIFQQQEELETLRRRLEEIESELTRSRCIKQENGNVASTSMEGSSFAKKLMDIYAAGGEDPGMEKSMDLDKSLDMEMGKRDHNKTNSIQAILGYPFMDNLKNEVEDDGDDVYVPQDEEEEEEEEEDKEVQKEVIEENTVYSVKKDDFKFDMDSLTPNPSLECGGGGASSRHLRIQNIFTLCGNYRELSSQQHTLSMETPGVVDEEEKQTAKVVLDSKENCSPLSCSKEDNKSDVVEVVVKWEAAAPLIENGGKVITTLRLVKDATLADLRKLVEIYLAADNQPFTFLALGGDPTGAPVGKEEEALVLATKLPTCSNISNGQMRRQHLACLRKVDSNHHHIPLEKKLPFTSLENKLPLENKLASVSADQTPHFLLV